MATKNDTTWKDGQFAVVPGIGWYGSMESIEPMAGAWDLEHAQAIARKSGLGARVVAWRVWPIRGHELDKVPTATAAPTPQGRYMIDEDGCSVFVPGQDD